MMTRTEFKKLRKQLGWTREQAATELGISYYTVRRWEEGIGKIPGPAARVLEMLAEERVGKEAKGGS